MEFQKLGESDLSKVADLLRNYWKERNMDYSKSWTLDYLSKGHSTEIKQDQFFVLKEENKMIGCISIIVYEGNVAEVRDLVVEKEFRNKGYGKKLLQFLIDWCKKNNIRKLYALIFPQNINLFNNFGFIQEGFLKNHFTDNEDLIIVSLFIKKEIDKQQDLKKKLEDLSAVEDIEHMTSEKLRKLKTKKGL